MKNLIYLSIAALLITGCGTRADGTRRPARVVMKDPNYDCYCTCRPAGSKPCNCKGCPRRP
jgi:hypothetical protein